MRGTFRKLSSRRNLIADLMHASMGVPLISFRRTLDVRTLMQARAAAGDRPGLAAIFVKAFSLVARDEPILRTLHVGGLLPHLFELPCSIGMVAIARCEDGEDCVLMHKLIAADEMSLAEIDASIRHGKTAPLCEVPAFRKMLQISRLPLPLRRLAWGFALGSGRLRANYFGSFGISSVSAYGPGDLYPLSPGPFLLSYGVVGPDHTVDVVMRWDHRVTDAAMIAKSLIRLEKTLNGEIAGELRGSARAGAKSVHSIDIPAVSS